VIKADLVSKARSNAMSFAFTQYDNVEARGKKARFGIRLEMPILRGCCLGGRDAQ